MSLKDVKPEPSGREDPKIEALKAEIEALKTKTDNIKAEVDNVKVDLEKVKASQNLNLISFWGNFP